MSNTTNTTNTGYRNTGYRNTGDRNTGYWNTGNRNTGDRNTGNCNTGDWNTGDWNTGDWNTGDWNTGYRNTGYFNTDTPSTVRVFGVEVDRETFDLWIKPNWLYFKLTEFISEKDMTDAEKSENAGYKTIEGYLKKHDYKEAFQKSYSEATREDQLRITECPGFDAEMFFEISGIRVGEDVEEMTMEQVCKALGKTIKITK